MSRDGDQHFARDRNAFLSRRLRSGGACAMRSRISSGTETRSSFFMNSALRALTSGQMPATTGIRQCSMRRRKFSSSREIEDRLRDRILRAGLHFVFEAADLFIEIRTARDLRPRRSRIPCPRRSGCRRYPARDSGCERCSPDRWRPRRTLPSRRDSSPIFGGSPVMQIKLRMPVAAAPSRSD